MSESHWLCRACLILSIASVLIGDVYAASYMVGDDVGTWTIPATTNELNYTTWSNARNFRFGDELVFRYSNLSHSVLVVNQTDYKDCILDEPLALHSSGEDTIKLNLPGVRDYFFICGIPSHCTLGQKLQVTLVGSVPNSPPLPEDASPPSKSDASPGHALYGFVEFAIRAAFLLVCLSSTYLV